MKLIFASILFLFTAYSDVSEQDIINTFSSSDLVIKAKVIDIRAVSGMKIICNLEVEKIYKGKRLKTVLIQLDNENEMILYKTYLLYLVKSHNKKTSYFINKRRIKKTDEFFQNEIDYIISLVESKKLKKVKNPTPKHEINFGCGCD